MSQTVHESVLLNEIVENLHLNPGDVLVDGTFGGGGHTLALLKKMPGIKVIALDQDKDAFSRAKPKFTEASHNLTFVNDNFRNLVQVLEKQGVGVISGLVLDLGLSSDQLNASGRGFSFMRNEPLIMTMKENPEPEDLTAREIVNIWEEGSLADIIYGYGEEKYARRIAKQIVDSRKDKEIETTFDLVEIIKSAVPASYQHGRIHPATRTFQALRIAVNDELGALRAGLLAGFQVLRSGGRICVISFHSLEDRVVKNYFKEWVKSGEAKMINKKPIIPKDEELKRNPRSRSAKLRILEKI